MNSVTYQVAFPLGCGNSNNTDMADVAGAQKLSLSSQSLGSLSFLTGVGDVSGAEWGIFPSQFSSSYLKY